MADVTGTPEKLRAFEDLRNNYYNESVANIVKNVTEQNRIVERDGRLIRKLSPVYITPKEQSNIFDYRAQFYVAEKHFAGQKFSTLEFNVGFIWFMSIILYITLYFDLLRKLVNWKRPGRT